jgi:chromosome segregation ATPase
MQLVKKIIFFLIPPLFIFLLLGCSPPQEQVDIILPPDSIDQQQSAKRFQEPTPQGRTAVESAIELSEKYAELSEQAATLREKIQGLTTENTQLKRQVASLEIKLKQTQKELTEANDFLIEMRIELNNWKTNVLGFRNEMRQAEEAQLEALLKILKILGGEIMVESAQGEDVGSAIGTPNEPNQLEPQETSTLGEPNE